MIQPMENQKKSRPVATAFLVLYVLFLGACLFVTSIDPPGKGSGGAGILGFMATMAAGLPWSVIIVILPLMANCESCMSGPRADVVLIVLCWIGAFVNFVLLARAAGWTEAPPAPPPRPKLPREPQPEPRAAAAIGPRMPLRVALARQVAIAADRLDTARSRRAVTVPAVVLTFLLGVPAAMGLLAGMQAGRLVAQGPIWSLAVLLALAGTWCRLLSSNVQLRQSRLRFGLAAAGTALGLVLAVLSAVGWIRHAPLLALLAVLLVAWHGWLLLATLASRRIGG